MSSMCSSTRRSRCVPPPDITLICQATRQTWLLRTNAVTMTMTAFSKDGKHFIRVTPYKDHMSFPVHDWVTAICLLCHGREAAGFKSKASLGHGTTQEGEEEGDFIGSSHFGLMRCSGCSLRVNQTLNNKGDIREICKVNS